MISEKYMNLINELKEIRLLDSNEKEDDKIREDIERKINRYEIIANELSNCDDSSIIPYMCSIVEDDATELSAVEYLLKMILKIVKKDIDSGIREIIKGSVYMIPQGKDEAINLHIAIMQNQDLKKCYKRNIINSTNNEKSVAKIIMEEINESFGDDVDIKDILSTI